MSEMKPYIVRQGDYAARIAMQVGCEEHQVEDSEKNKPLWDDGRTRDILKPGDVLFVTDQGKHAEPISVGGSNAFSGQTKSVPVRVRFDGETESLAHAQYRVDFAGGTLSDVTDANGTAEFRVPTHVATVAVTFPDHALAFCLAIGFIDPIETTSGQVTRLRQLGYLRSSMGEQFASEDLPGAIASFQQNHGLAETGQIDDDTIRTLRRVFGC